MFDRKTCVINVNLPDRYLSAVCEWSFQQHSGKHGIRNFYLVPKSIDYNDDGKVLAKGHEVSISDEYHSSMTYVLDSSRAPAVADFLKSLFEGYDELAAAFLISEESGYVAHSEFMVYRLEGCASISSAQSFLSPLSKIRSFTGLVNNSQDVAKALEASIGGLVFQFSTAKQQIPQIEHELEQRLTLPWFLTERPRERRVCIVMPRTSTTVTKYRWETAAALGVKVVILSSGSWWTDGCEPYENLRESFISIDLTSDDGLFQRIVDAIESYPHSIDGIFTINDNYLTSVARAAEKLGLFTPGPEPYSISTNKYLTRQLMEPDSVEYFTVRAVQDLEKRMDSGNSIRFPVISKPSFGEGSEGVFRADDIAELKDAIGKTLESTKGCHALVEPYVNGPEFDANLVLFEGQLLYSEIVDDFPSPAELQGESLGALFTETQTAVPSKLPDTEKEAIINAMVAIVQKMGFETGILHCEGRVRNSSMEFALNPGSSIPDLQPVTNLDTNKKPSMFLHEVNARIPGIMSSASSLIAKGIDFWALQILYAVSDWSRYKGLATPFLPDVLCNYVSLTNVMVDISPELVKEIFPNIPMDQLNWAMVTSNHDPMPELSRRYGNIKRYVLRHTALVKPTHTIGGSRDGWIWADTAVICSSLSRKHALYVAEVFEEVYEAVVKKKDDHARRR